MTIEIVDIVHSVLLLCPTGQVSFTNARLEQHTKSSCPELQNVLMLRDVVVFPLNTTETDSCGELFVC